MNLHFKWLSASLVFIFLQNTHLNAQNNRASDNLLFAIKTATTALDQSAISGVMNDKTDPAATVGIDLLIKDGNAAIDSNQYTVTVASDNPLVVANSGIQIIRHKGYATIKIMPVGVGYSTIVFTLSKGAFTKTLSISYAASSGDTSTANTFWHTGICDASAAIPVDDNYMLIGDDEQNGLYLYNRKKSGEALKAYMYNDMLGYAGCNKGKCEEADVEAAVKSIAHKGRIYWLGSMSNGKAPKAKDKQNRNRIFATDISGTGSNVAFSFAGYYADLRSSLLQWGDNNGYKLSNSAAAGQDPKEKDGFNAEGMAFAPDDTTLFIGLRAPIVPVKKRDKALIAPLLNFETFFNNGKPDAKPIFGQPMELNLGGRGIRDIVRLSNGMYIIAAGSCDGEPNSALYKWTGNKGDEPVWLDKFNTTGLNVEGIAEINENGSMALDKLQVVCDEGSHILYGDGVESKNLSAAPFKKFRSVVLSASSKVLGK